MKKLPFYLLVVTILIIWGFSFFIFKYSEYWDFRDALNNLNDEQSYYSQINSVHNNLWKISRYFENNLVEPSIDFTKENIVKLEDNSTYEYTTSYENINYYLDAKLFDNNRFIVLNFLWTDRITWFMPFLYNETRTIRNWLIAWNFYWTIDSNSLILTNQNSLNLEDLISINNNYERAKLITLPKLEDQEWNIYWYILRINVPIHENKVSMNTKIIN